MAIGTHNKRYKTLKEHRAAVAARKQLQGGKNKGPVANADAYGSTLKKPKAKAKKVATAPKPNSRKSTPKKTATKKAVTKKQQSSSSGPRKNQTVNGASLGSYLTPAERAKRKANMTPEAVQAGASKPTKKKKQGQSPRAGSRARNKGTTPKKAPPSRAKRSRRQNRRSRG